MDDRKVFKNGFSLIELMIGMGILAGATLGASKVMEIVASSSKDSEIRAELKQAYGRIDKDIGLNYRGLTDVEFNQEYLYYVNGNNLARVSTNAASLTEEMKLNNWFKKTGSKGVYTSFSFIRKSKLSTEQQKRYERMFTVCIPIEEALISYDEDMTVEKMSQLTHWPFMSTNSAGQMSIRCCPLSTPNCIEPGSNVISKDTNFLLRVVRNDIIHNYVEDPADSGNYEHDESLDQQVIQYTPKKGDVRRVTGAGFFSALRTSNISDNNSIFIYNIVYQADCLVERIKDINFDTSKCKSRFKIEKKVQAFQINSTMGGGANDLGNVGW